MPAVGNVNLIGGATSTDVLQATVAVDVAPVNGDLTTTETVTTPTDVGVTVKPMVPVEGA